MSWKATSTSNICIGLAFSLAALIARANPPKDCVPHELSSHLIEHEKLTLDDLLQSLTNLDSSLSSVHARADQMDQVLRLRQRIDAALDKLSSLPENDTAQKQEIHQEIASMKGEIYELRHPQKKEELRQSAPRSASSELSQISDFEQIQAHQSYGVPDGHGRMVQVRFTENALKDLNSRKVHKQVRSELFQALLHGVVPGTKLRGIKLMKTHDKVSFAEVKCIGGAAGEFRIYGCIEEHGDITFHFLGTDMSSPTDPQRLKIKNLCRQPGHH